MKTTVMFKGSFGPLSIDCTCSGTSQEIVTDLRNDIADKLPFYLSKLRGQIRPGKKRSWTDAEFFKEATDAWNKEHPDKAVTCPTTCMMFIGTCVGIGLATMVDGKA